MIKTSLVIREMLYYNEGNLPNVIVVCFRLMRQIIVGGTYIFQ